MIKTLLELLREENYTEKEIKAFYKKREKLAEMNIRYGLNEFNREKRSWR